MWGFFNWMSADECVNTNLQSQTERLIASDCRVLTDRRAFSRGGETPSRCVLSWWYHFYTIQWSSQLSLFPFFAWLGSMSPADRNWPRTVATEITGVKLPQLADNCNKQAVSGAKPPLKRTPCISFTKGYNEAPRGSAGRTERQTQVQAGLNVRDAAGGRFKVKPRGNEWRLDKCKSVCTRQCEVSHICGICSFQIPTWMNRFQSDVSVPFTASINK